MKTAIYNCEEEKIKNAIEISVFESYNSLAQNDPDKQGGLDIDYLFEVACFSVPGIQQFSNEKIFSYIRKANEEYAKEKDDENY